MACVALRCAAFCRPQPALASFPGPEFGGRYLKRGVPLGDGGTGAKRLNLSSTGTMSKDIKDWVAFRCEVAVRLRAFGCPGFEDFNEACGHKTMPYS